MGSPASGFQSAGWIPVRPWHVPPIITVNSSEKHWNLFSGFMLTSLTSENLSPSVPSGTKMLTRAHQGRKVQVVLGWHENDRNAFYNSELLVDPVGAWPCLTPTVVTRCHQALCWRKRLASGIPWHTIREPCIHIYTNSIVYAKVPHASWDPATWPPWPIEDCLPVFCLVIFMDQVPFVNSLSSIFAQWLIERLQTSSSESTEGASKSSRHSNRASHHSHDRWAPKDLENWHTYRTYWTYRPNSTAVTRLFWAQRVLEIEPLRAAVALTTDLLSCSACSASYVVQLGALHSQRRQQWVHSALARASWRFQTLKICRSEARKPHPDIMIHECWCRMRPNAEWSSGHGT